MKNLLTFLFALTIVTGTFAQKKFEGKAVYMSKRSLDLSRFGDRINRMSEQQKAQMMNRMKSFLEKNYTLNFNKTESIFKENVALETPRSSRGFRMGGMSGQGTVYKNLREKSMIEDVEMFGKRFLVTEDMEQLQWEMSTETKKIGQYTCYKATLVKEDTNIDFGRMFRRNQPKDSTQTKQEEKNMLTVTAWYTPQIPVSAGPASYWGLPGLILELNEGETTMLCTEIVINPENAVAIAKPTKGKEVSREQYNKEVKKKTEELREQFMNRGRGRGRGRF